MLIRRVARPMLASIFIAGGIDSLRKPAGRAKRAAPYIEKGTHALPVDVADHVPSDPETLVRINGAIQVGGGLLLAIGKAPRLASLALAGTLVPSTIAGHAFWDEEDADLRAAQRTQFIKNVSLLGGLLIASVDTEGKPSIGWRGRRAARMAGQTLTSALPIGNADSSAVGERLSETAHVASERAHHFAGVASDRGSKLAQIAAHRGSELADAALRHGSELAEVVSELAELAREHGSELAEVARVHGSELAAVAREHAPELAELARERGSELAEVVSELAELAREHGSDLAEVAREHAPELAEAAREHGRELAEVARVHGSDWAAALPVHGADLSSRARKRAEKAAKKARARAAYLGV